MRFYNSLENLSALTLEPYGAYAKQYDKEHPSLSGQPKKATCNGLALAAITLQSGEGLSGKSFRGSN